MINRYVNTNSLIGGDGTTSATTGANRAFPTMGAAFTALAGSGFADDLTISCAGGTDNSTCDIGTGYVSLGHVVNVVGEETSGVWNETKYIKTSDSVNNAGVNITSTVNTDNLVFSGVQWLISSNNHVAIYADATAVCNIRISKCIGKVDATSCIYNVIWTRSASCSVVVENSIVAHTGSGVCTGYGIALTSISNARVYNTLVRGFQIGITTGASSVAVNCAVLGCTTDMSTNANYCATSGGYGSNPITISDWNSQFYNGASSVSSVNYSISSGSELLGVGIGPTADANVPTDDILNWTRSGAVASVGPFEHEAGWSDEPEDNPLCGLIGFIAYGMNLIGAI